MVNIFDLPYDQQYATHGAWGPQQYLDAAPYDCLMHICMAQLVLDNPAGVDERANAKWLMQMGGDFYPAQGGNQSLFGRFIAFPGFSASRLKYVTSTPQWFSTSNLSNARQDYIGPNSSVTVASFLANPPPRSLVEA